jgi:cytochrome c553
MARLIYFLIFVGGLVFVMNISKFDKKEVSNEKFDFAKTAEANKKKAEEIAKLMAPKKEEKEEVKVVKAGPLVELTTPQLQAGHDLYKKCIVCHGKRGEGKKAQNAPAIGGQYNWYIQTQVANMISGVRVNKVMMPYISRLSTEDVAALSEYISKLPFMGRK